MHVGRSPVVVVALVVLLALSAVSPALAADAPVGTPYSAPAEDLKVKP